MKLSILERFLVKDLLPKEHEIFMLEEARRLKDNLSISEEENKIVDIRFCSDWAENGCPRCESFDFVKEKDDSGYLTTRRICNVCGNRGAQGDAGSAIWKELPEQKDIDFSDAMVREISTTLKALNKRGKVKDSQLELYKKFIPE